MSTLSEHEPRKRIAYVLEPIYILWAHNTETSSQLTMSRMTYLILRVHTGTGVSHSQRRKKDFEKYAREWIRRVEISKEEIPGSKPSM